MLNRALADSFWESKSATAEVDRLPWLAGARLVPFERLCSVSASFLIFLRFGALRYVTLSTPIYLEVNQKHYVSKVQYVDMAFDSGVWHLC